MAPLPGISLDSGYVCKLKKALYDRIILSLYVDNRIIASDDIDGISVLKTELARRFEMKELDVLEWTRLTDNMTVDTPIEVNARYSFSDGLPLINPTLYHTIIENLVYLTITRLDIAYDVRVVSQFVVSSTTVHWAAVLRNDIFGV
ncbi:PREDICTED: uncharacterized protein LOC105112961 [Populus euphratica]|uniref:Uncharacterized protein LOC105112961 n=1 Tax=Populus euphratica TaxID=75702 RepID=A0AAJ6X673_POPEU|nr:PREDICTED: uncharacterized protein LOC105112961 [Populus euphratica]